MKKGERKRKKGKESGKRGKKAEKGKESGKR